MLGETAGKHVGLKEILPKEYCAVCCLQSDMVTIHYCEACWWDHRFKCLRILRQFILEFNDSIAVVVSANGI